MAEVFFEKLLRGKRGVSEAFKLMVLAFRFRIRSKRFGIRPSILELTKAMIKYY
jgi:hypothetical protein